MEYKKHSMRLISKDSTSKNQNDWSMLGKLPQVVVEGTAVRIEKGQRWLKITALTINTQAKTEC